MGHEKGTEDFTASPTEWDAQTTRADRAPSLAEHVHARQHREAVEVARAQANAQMRAGRRR